MYAFRRSSTHKISLDYNSSHLNGINLKISLIKADGQMADFSVV